MIIGVAGTIGAGKETLTSFFRENGFVYFETSAIIKEALIKEGIEVTRTNMQDWADKQRENFGQSALMKIMLEKAMLEPSKNYMFDSLRNDGEAEFLRKNVKDFFLIAVDAAREIRFKRIISRAKPHDPKTWEDFLVVDNRDLCDTSNPLGQQTQKLIDMADFVVINDKDLESARKQVKDIYRQLFKPSL
jgi:dephospho-CoA kinase